jgi:hypothetical protein
VRQHTGSRHEFEKKLGFESLELVDLPKLVKSGKNANEVQNKKTKKCYII